MLHSICSWKFKYPSLEKTGTLDILLGKWMQQRLRPVVTCKATFQCGLTINNSKIWWNHLKDL